MVSSQTSSAAGRSARSVWNCWMRTDRKSTRLNSSHLGISYAVFCLKKKKNKVQSNKNASLNTPTNTRTVSLNQQPTNHTKIQLIFTQTHTVSITKQLNSANNDLQTS